MIIQVDLQLPTGGPLHLSLPPFNPPKDSGCGEQSSEEFNIQEWVWQHGKEQLLSTLRFSFVPPSSAATDYKTAEDAKEEGGEEEESESQRSSNKNLNDSSLIQGGSRVEMSEDSIYLESLVSLQGRRRNHPSDSKSEQEPQGEQDSNRERLTGGSNKNKTKNNNNSQSSSTADDTPDQHRLRRRLDLLEGLQKVQQEFLEQEQKASELTREENTNNKPNWPSRSPVDKAFNSLLDSVVTWSGCDYGLIAKVESSKKTTGDENDEGEGGNDNGSKLQPQLSMELNKCASLNVPTFSFDQSQTDNDDSSTSSSSDSSCDDDSVQEGQLRCPRKPPQPVTTYGPVYYKSIRGSVTLMMDQLRYEPVNPLDLIHDDLDSDDEGDEEDFNASNEYNNVTVYWDKVVKYQLTPKSSAKHLFKLITSCGSSCRLNQPGANNNIQQPINTSKTKEVILKMSSRAELERIAQDVKARVVLPSKHPRSNPTKKIKKKKKRKDRESRNPSSAPARSMSPPSPNLSQLTPQQRSIMLPPSLPRRMTSERNLQPDSNHLRINSTHHKNVADPPFHPVRRTTMDSMEDLSFVSDDDSDDDYKDETGSSTTSEEEEVQEQTEEDLYLWSVEDIIWKLFRLRKPLILGPGKRDNRQKLLWEKKVKAGTEKPKNGNKVDTEDGDAKEIKRQMLLLPQQWQTLIAVPCFTNDVISGVIVIANTSQDDDGSCDEPKDSLGEDAVAWWGPVVTTLSKDFLQQKHRLDQLAEKTKAFKELEVKLQDSLRRQKEMIHGILPPEAVSKLKAHPQQWKSPLQYPAVPPSVTQYTSGDIGSVHDSSISGSVNSRFGMFVNSAPTPPDNESNVTDPDYHLYSLSEGEEKQEQPDPRKQVPERSNSSKTAAQPIRPVPPRSSSGAALRLHRQSSMTNRGGGRPGLLSRMDSGKRGMLMMPGPGNLVRFDSARFGRPGIPRLNSLKSLHGNISAQGSNGSSSIDTMDQSWRTMYTNDESFTSINPEDLPKTRANSVNSKDDTNNLPSTDVSRITVDSNIRYINSIGSNADISTVQALYAGHKSNVTIVFMSVVNFADFGKDGDPGQFMDALAKLTFSLDRLCSKYGTIKVETNGTSILVMSGLFTEESDKDDDDGEEDDTYGSFSRDRKAATDALELAKEIVSAAQSIPLSNVKEFTNCASSVGSGKKNEQDPETLKLRVGIHLGKVTYGVIGQTVPKLVCFGKDIVVAARMEETANENCIRASKAFHDFVGKNERGWDNDTEFVDVVREVARQDSATVSTALMSSTSSSIEGSAGQRLLLPTPSTSKAPMETYTLEPPPPAISDAFSQGYSSCASSFPSLSPWGSSELFPYDGGNMLDVQLEESFVSGEFYVD